MSIDKLKKIKKNYITIFVSLIIYLGTPPNPFQVEIMLLSFLIRVASRLKISM